jgi:hypothetical protein
VVGPGPYWFEPCLVPGWFDDESEEDWLIGVAAALVQPEPSAVIETAVAGARRALVRQATEGNKRGFLELAFGWQTRPASRGWVLWRLGQNTPKLREEGRVERLWRNRSNQSARTTRRVALSLRRSLEFQNGGGTMRNSDELGSKWTVDTAYACRRVDRAQRSLSTS